MEEKRVGKKKKRREKKRGFDWAGPKIRERGKSFAFFFENDPNQFNSNSNSREFKLELNNEQWNNVLRHECRTTQTSSFNLENNQSIFFCTNFLVR